MSGPGFPGAAAARPIRRGSCLSSRRRRPGRRTNSVLRVAAAGRFRRLAQGGGSLRANRPCHGVKVIAYMPGCEFDTLELTAESPSIQELGCRRTVVKHSCWNDHAAAAMNRIPSHRLEFVIASDLVVDGDPHLLEIVLNNLVGKAWQLTSKHHQPHSEVGLVDHEGECVLRA